jgi:hypothetical protein
METIANGEELEVPEVVDGSTVGGHASSLVG